MPYLQHNQGSSMLYRTFYMDQSDADQWTIEDQYYNLEDGPSEVWQIPDINYDDIYRAGWYVWTMDNNDVVHHDPEDGPHDPYLYQSLDGPFDTEEMAVQTICTNQFAEIQLHDE